MNEKTITLDHIRQAAEWAKQAASEAMPIDGEVRKYNQTTWDCGTSCCMWGAASLIAGQGQTLQGPSDEWAGASALHTLTVGLLRSGTTSPDQVLEILARADLRDADLSGADLRGADLRDADLSGATVTVGNVARKLA